MAKSITNENIINFVKSLYPNKDFISLHEPVFFEEDKNYVLDAIESTFVSSVGMYVDTFEKMICDYTGSKYAVAVVNGTSALHISLKLAGVKRNDLVLTQPLSFIATCNAISYLGAEPCFVDINKETLGLCPLALKSFLTRSTYIKDKQCFENNSKRRISACVPMHTFGFPVQIESIIEVCNEFYIPVVEDSAESLGSIYNGKHTGTFGLLGTYSLNGNKTITCGGGGVIVTNDKKLALQAKHLTTQAKIPHKWEFRHDDIGFNYRMPNLNAALACAQLNRIESYIQDKKETYKMYKNFFHESDYQFIEEPIRSRSNYWLNSILVESLEKRNELLEYLNTNGVMTRPTWTLLNKMKMFEHCMKDSLINSLNVESRLINLPSSVRL